MPRNVSATTGNMLRTLVVQWEPPSSPGGIITTYMVTYDEITVDTSNNDTTYTITGLETYTNYSITVTACNSNGCGIEPYGKWEKMHKCDIKGKCHCINVISKGNVIA